MRVPRATHPFDMWMRREYRQVPFERYADDAICHCRTQEQAQQLESDLRRRFEDCKLELHPQKTKIVYCADSRRKTEYSLVQFDFLGYAFRPRFVKSKSGYCNVGFNPAISPKSAQEIRKTMRSWRLGRRTDLAIEAIARWINPILRGWFQYYGRFYRSALDAIVHALEEQLATWAMRKYRNVPGRAEARKWVAEVLRNRPMLFEHRRFVTTTVG